MVLVRRFWGCGEADWLTSVAGITDLKSTVGYPLSLSAREVAELVDRGVTPAEARRAAEEGR